MIAHFLNRIRLQLIGKHQKTMNISFLCYNLKPEYVMDITSFNISNLSVIAVAVSAAFIAALWLSIIFWVIRDIRSRSRDPLMTFLSVLLVIVLFIPGIIIYRIIRPGQTFEEKYHAALEEEALLREMEKQLRCPSCGKPVKENWILCPNCHTKMKKKCIVCGGLMELQWNICPICGEQQQKPYNEISGKPESAK